MVDLGAHLKQLDSSVGNASVFRLRSWGSNPIWGQYVQSLKNSFFQKQFSRLKWFLLERLVLPRILETPFLKKQGFQRKMVLGRTSSQKEKKKEL